MTLTDKEKQKRNKPCENCRAHRRRCTVSQGTRCDRCIRMALPCIFKFSVKPVAKRSISIAQGVRMSEDILWLGQELMELEEQLHRMKIDVRKCPETNFALMHNTKNDAQFVECLNASPNNGDNGNGKQENDEEMTIDDHNGRKRRRHSLNNGWHLTVSQRGNNVCFQTTIRTITDMSIFLQDVLRRFSVGTPYHSPNYHTDRRQQTIVVNTRTLHVEKALMDMFTRKRLENNIARVPSTVSESSYISIQLHLIDVYFTCLGVLMPIFVHPYYHPRLLSRPNSMLTLAVASYVGYTQCQHVDIKGISAAERKQLVDAYRQDARNMLQDALFESPEPDVDTISTLIFLAHSALILLYNGEARTYIGLALQLSMQLKDHCIEVLRQPELATPEEVIEAETWRRMFYLVRDLEISLHLLYRDRVSMSTTVSMQHMVGEPMLLECEKYNPRLVKAVAGYRHMVRLSNFYALFRVSNIGYCLRTASIDSVPCAHVEQVENQLFSFWQSLPPEFCLSRHPMEHLELSRVEQCKDSHAIYLNGLFYAYWLEFEIRVMNAPSHANVKDATTSRVDGDRALVIVSICCDAMTKIFKVLSTRRPCIIELHWVLFASDIMGILAQSNDPEIRKQANRNLQITLDILKHCINFENADTTKQNYCRTQYSSKDRHSHQSSAGVTPIPSLSTDSTSSSSSDHSAISSISSPSLDESDMLCDSTVSSPSTYKTMSVLPVNYIQELKQTVESCFLNRS